MNWEVDQLAALAAVATEGSFEAAAARLHVTPSAISQRIKALETAVGSVLLVRSRPVEVTEPGRTVLRAARQIETILHDAAGELGEPDAGSTRPLALAVNADSLATWLLPALAAVEAPIAFDLRRADQTRTAELLRDGSVSAAVTAAADPVPGCSVTPLGRMRYRPRASAAFIDRWFADGVTPAALERAPVIQFDRTDGLQDVYLRRRARRSLTPPRHHVPGSSEFVRAIELGLGWGLVPDLQSAEDRLACFDPEGGVDVELYWQQWRLRSPVLEAVAEEIRAHAREALQPPTGRRGRSGELGTTR